MRRYGLLVGFCLLLSPAIGQQNLNFEFIANVNDYEQEGYSDVWGFVDQNGREYAIIGTRQATLIYDLEDPGEPIEVARIPGANSIWRDFKDFNDHIFVTTDQGNDGLLIIDMSRAPSDVTWEFWQPTIEIDELPLTLSTCHNLYIDDNGYCYLSGCNINQGGILVIDVNDPANPRFVGAGDRRYSHDNFSRGDTVWSADISSGVFSVIDVKDKANPITLTTQSTSSNFTHNCWLSDDGKYLFTTDERANAFVDAYDVSDLDNIRFLDSYRPLETEGLGVIPHNTHYHNGFLVTSWYTDGIVVVDAHRPDNLIKVAQYDTYPGIDGGFNGCWGAYPFLPSGLMLVSDIQTGLYVFRPTYQKACYLEGIVTDAATGFGIEGVRVEILSDQTNRSMTNFGGLYKTGQATGGNFEVRFLKEGYRVTTLNTTLVNGEVTQLDVTLQPLGTISFSGKTMSKEDGTPIPNASIILFNEISTFTGRSDRDGNFVFTDIYEDQYQIQSAAWGYLHTSLDPISIEANQNFEIELEEGYQDDFFADLGWQSTTDSATAGLWIRGIPIRTAFGDVLANPGEDVSGDIGEQCFMTGNRGESAGFDDVDNGKVTLTSPVLSLQDYDNPILHFDYWFFNEGGTPPQDDRLTVFIDNGQNRVLVDTFANSSSEWRSSPDYFLKDYIELTDEMRVVFETGDQADSGHLVEAAIDAFSVLEEVVEDTTTTSIDNISEGIEVSVAPNPFQQVFRLNVSLDRPYFVQVYNSLGQFIERYQLLEGNFTFGENWVRGVYWITIQTAGESTKHTLRVVKQ